MIAHPFSGRLRSGLTLTSCANVWFQGQAADMFVYAYSKAWYESVFVPSSPLFGCTIVLPIHDEIVGTCPIEQVRAKVGKGGRVVAVAAPEQRLSEIMLEAATVYLPGMLVETSGAVLAEPWPDPVTPAEVAAFEAACARVRAITGAETVAANAAPGAANARPMRAQRWRKV